MPRIFTDLQYTICIYATGTFLIEEPDDLGTNFVIFYSLSLLLTVLTLCSTPFLLFSFPLFSSYIRLSVLFPFLSFSFLYPFFPLNFSSRAPNSTPLSLSVTLGASDSRQHAYHTCGAGSRRYYILQIALGFLPYFIRLCQSIRAYKDTKDVRNLFNGLKYLLSMTVTGLAVAHTASINGTLVEEVRLL